MGSHHERVPSAKYLASSASVRPGRREEWYLLLWSLREAGWEWPPLEVAQGTHSVTHFKDICLFPCDHDALDEPGLGDFSSLRRSSTCFVAWEVGPCPQLPPSGCRSGQADTRSLPAHPHPVGRTIRGGVGET